MCLNCLALPGRGADILQESRRLVADESRHLHLSKRRSDILLFFPSYICFRHVKRIPHGASIRSIVQIKQIVFEQVFVTFVTSQKRALTVALVFCHFAVVLVVESCRVSRVSASERRGVEWSRAAAGVTRRRRTAQQRRADTAGTTASTDGRPAASVLNQTSTVPSLFASLLQLHFLNYFDIKLITTINIQYNAVNSFII